MITFLSKKKRVFLFCFVGVLLFSFLSALAEGSDRNLLYNPDFSILDAEGFPDGWFTDAYIVDPGYTDFQVVTDVENESPYLFIQNFAKNDARFAQTVEVEPDSLYCFSGYIRADEVTGGHGANLSIEGIYSFSDPVFDTSGDWEYVTYYGETDSETTYITLYARVGGYSGESQGAASFRDLKLIKVESLPENVIAARWYTESYDSEYEYDEDEEEKTTHAAAWPWLLGISALYLIVFYGLIRYFRDGDAVSLRQSDFWWVHSFPILFAALGIRILISFFVEGYMVDVNCFLSWGHTMAAYGPTQFYQQTNFCDYPPMYTYILGLNSWISGFFHIPVEWTRVIFRFFPSLCDVTAIWILLRTLCEKKILNERYEKCILLLMAFNPATILNSAAWGQMDSVLCLLILLVAIFSVRKKFHLAIPVYLVAVLVKPQALMLGFLGLTFLLLIFIREKECRRSMISGVLICIPVALLCILPFGIHQSFGWLISQYAQTLSSYPYATVNTANLYYLAGGNWSSISHTANEMAPLVLFALSGGFGVLCYLKNKNEKGRFAEPLLSAAFSVWFIVCLAMHLSWTYVGSAAMAFAFVIVLSIAIRKGNLQYLSYLGALLFILLYVFGIKMHERYLFPALLLLLHAWVLQKDRRILYILLLFSVTIFINEGIILDNSIRLGSELGHLNNDTLWLADILSIMNILGAVYTVFLGLNLGSERVVSYQARSFFPVRHIDPGAERRHVFLDRKLYWNWKDSVLLLSVTGLFTLISLLTLGSVKAPQTTWTSSSEEEQIVFDLGKKQEDIRILYFGQVSRYDFLIEQSDNMEEWTRDTYAQMDQGQCWKWKYVTQSYEGPNNQRTYYNNEPYIIHFSGRYIRLTSCQIGLVLNELLFRDPDGNPIPASVKQHTGANEASVLFSDPKALLDEQDTLENLPAFLGTQSGEAQPSWWNSTYFDEIYHARTGFEFLHGTVPYETSHPPLGKVLMSFAIAVFGMTPFGWRFAGALAGILMLPAIYLLAKQLTKKRWIAGLCMTLMALDCMHLTQSQIATIDSFPVLFIILSYFFMLRFMQTDLRESLKTLLIPLAFSGFFMGLSIASKWIGIYAGIGLAILFAWHCLRQIGAGGRKNDLLYKGSDSHLYNPLQRVFTISLWCVLFFVLIPVMIYLISYIPYMAYNTRIKSLTDYLSAVWKAQEGMLSYHSTPGLGMDHPFYSPWWEWPIIRKPMYYATEQYIDKASPLHHSIFCIGNPVIWWGALGSLCINLFVWIRKKHYQLGDSIHRWHFVSLDHDYKYGFLFIGLLAQYLPWVLVPRGTYIYHYFASIPFLIISIGLNFTGFEETAEKPLKWIAFTLIGLALIAFVLFFPYASGIAVPTAWLEAGKGILHVYY